MRYSETENGMKSNLNIIVFALQQWKILLSIAILAGIFSTIFSSSKFISPKYESEAIIFPMNLIAYGEETALEQMLQYLESNEIRDYIIKKYNLIDEYDISRDELSVKTLVNKAYAKHIQFNKTKFESIRITVLSTDAAKARDIVNSIIDKLDDLIRETERKKYQEIVDINEKMVGEKKHQLDSLEVSIKEISVQYGLLDYIAQSERVTEKYLEFLLSGKRGKDFNEAKTLFDNLKEYGRSFHNLHTQLEIINEEYMKRRSELEDALKDLEKYQTYSNVLVKPEIADRKSYPIRWLIILFSVISCVGFTFMLLLILGYQRK